MVAYATEWLQETTGTRVDPYITALSDTGAPGASAKRQASRKAPATAPPPDFQAMFDELKKVNANVGKIATRVQALEAGAAAPPAPAAGGGDKGGDAAAKLAQVRLEVGGAPRRLGGTPKVIGYVDGPDGRVPLYAAGGGKGNAASSG